MDEAKGITVNEDGSVRVPGYSMDYPDTLRAAGFVVHAYETFGSYQGDWWAKVTNPEGGDGWVHGYFGSCSGCDALEAAFGYDFGDTVYHRDGTFTTYTADEWAKVVEFGQGEGADFHTQSAAEAEAAKNEEWDMEARNVVAFLRANSWEVSDG
jgi:hypothetical protein